MRLGQVVIPTINVQFGSEPEEFFPVRGLNLNDILSLLTDYGPDTIKMWDEFNTVREDLDGKPFTADIAIGIMVKALKEFPSLIFHGIALAAQDPDAAEVAAQLPLSVQVDTLQAIFAASVRTEAEVKKLGEFFQNLVKMGLIMRSKWIALSLGGSGVSASG